MLKKIKNLVVQEEGQALTEYGLIIALIAIAVTAGLTLVATTLYKADGTGLLNKIATKLTTP
jgi:pilus assembly protein Flp/PilA